MILRKFNPCQWPFECLAKNILKFQLYCGALVFLVNSWKVKKFCLEDVKTLSKISDSQTTSVNGSPKSQKLPERLFTAETYPNGVSLKHQFMVLPNYRMKRNFSHLCFWQDFLYLSLEGNTATHIISPPSYTPESLPAEIQRWEFHAKICIFFPRQNPCSGASSNSYSLNTFELEDPEWHWEENNQCCLQE